VLDAATLIRQTADERKKLVVLVEGLTETQASYRSAPDETHGGYFVCRASLAIVPINCN
jgi:hypothetical protein